MEGFYWLIADALAGSGLPGQRPRRARVPLDSPARPDAYANAHAAELEADLAWLRGRGIGAILTLTETPLPESAVADYGFASRHLPVRDMTAPSPEQFDAALDFIDHQRASGLRVLVHCLVGQGRTGSILAAYLIRGGLPPAEAIAQLRLVCPGAVESGEQRRALVAFAERRDWIL